jgi:hypothetical protein
MKLPTKREDRTVPEEKAWRDIKLSEWRKRLGWDLAANDLDLLVVEFNSSKPKALIEYKLEHAQVSQDKLVGVFELAQLASLPFFVVRYSEAFDWWMICPQNLIAKEKSGPIGIVKTERDYVIWLYKIRGIEAPAVCLTGLSDTLPVKGGAV